MSVLFYLYLQKTYPTEKHNTHDNSNTIDNGDKIHAIVNKNYNKKEQKKQLIINNKNKFIDTSNNNNDEYIINSNDDTNLDENTDNKNNEIDSGTNLKETSDGSIVLERPWYFEGGTRYPKQAGINKRTKKRNAKLFPSEDQINDRITNQLMFVPPNYQEIKKQKQYKTILLYNGLGAWNVKEGNVYKTSGWVFSFHSFFICT